jgi:hypothetical protein
MKGDGMLRDTTGSEERQAGAHSLQQSNAEQQAASATEQQNAPGGAEILIPPDEAKHLRARWDEVQTGFVDDPGQAVEDANQLVDEVTNRVVEIFTRGRSALEEQWSRGDDVTTEELRVVLQRYRSFFDSLLQKSTVGS